MSEPIQAALRPPEHRLKLVCETCGGYDDLPKHGYAMGGGQYVPTDPALIKRVVAAVPDADEGLNALREFLHGDLHNHHIDCGPAAGCDICVPARRKGRA